MAKQVRYGFIGGGAIARTHAAAIQAKGDTIVGVMDADKDRAEKFAKDFSADLATTHITTPVSYTHLTLPTN